MTLFKDVRYHISPSLSEDTISRITHVLDEQGASEVPLKEATHIITDSDRFEGWHEISVNVAIVTIAWVEQSMVVNKLQSVSGYSPSPGAIFSGVVACADGLTPLDMEALTAGITGLGGQWRNGLVRDVTHLFVITDTSPKYATALRYQDTTHIKVVLPHWFDDSIRLGIKGLDTTPYEWPSPEYAKLPLSNETSPSKKVHRSSPSKRILFKSIALSERDNPQSTPKDIWNGRSVLLSSSLELSANRRDAIESAIKRGSGIIIQNMNGADEASLIEKADVYVTRYRSGKAYFKAAKSRKTIGTLAWLFHVQATGVVTRPLDQLLHYPIPASEPDEFKQHVITITNYTGDSRDYLKKIIQMMGATFTPSMTSNNTVLIAAFLEGTKTTKAASWGIPVVNHLWVEDSFAKWRAMTISCPKYNDFPNAVNFTGALGDRVVSRSVDDLEELDMEEQDDEAVVDEVALLMGTANSAIDVTEVADAIRIDADGDDPMDVDGQAEEPNKEVRPGGDTRQRRRSLTPVQATVSPSTNMVTPKSTTKTRSVKKAPIYLPISPPTPIQYPEELNSGSDIDLPEVSALTSSFKKSKQDLKKPAKKLMPRKAKEQDTEQEAETSKAGRRKSLRNQEATEEYSTPTPLRQSPVKSILPIKRQVSVVLPGLKLHTAPLPPIPAASTSKKMAIPRIESMQISAAEQRVNAPPKHESVSPPPNHVEPSGRSSRRAAAAASERLSQIVMPDVMNFQQELRSERRRSSNTFEDSKRKSSVTAESDSEEPRTRKKKRPSALKQEIQGDKEEETLRPAKKQKIGKVEVVVNQENGADEQKGSQNRRVNKPNVRVMTTQVDLGNAEAALIKLGAKITTEPSDCTHLVVHHIVRTQKFLCALANAPYIVTEAWVNESIKAKTLLPPEKYLLKDKDGEKKFNFSLAESISRAKIDGKVFANQVFYITPGVRQVIDITLLGNVIKACGGKMTLQHMPTPRSLNTGDRHVISCPKDSDAWTSVEPQHPIYSHELILNAALKQVVEWDNASYQLREAVDI